MGSKDEAVPALFEALPKKVRDEVLGSARVRAYQADDVVVREGESALNLFIIKTGHARIERGDTVVGRFGPGDFFGELALLEQSNRTATVVAEADLSCYLIPVWEFRALLDAHPQMAIPMLHKLIDRLHTH